ncbi:mannitol-1-phosphate 5-dehydrogenase [Stomatohabitans albus]|uniref:mannitol-1-phosphate 5-dehydrogenase n=1 Tax=Stomatohabitans albus TaxID=3110766 RepID=UPI00300D1B09
MRAVHIGAGNIGRGFIGLVLYQAGYALTFTDVNADIIDAIDHSGTWKVHEVAPQGTTHTVTGVRAINSATDPDAAIAAMAQADIITTAVGASILPHIAPSIAKAIEMRSTDKPPVLVMACENAIRATDLLRAAVATHMEQAGHARWANTAVDRIVPSQSGAGLDVQVEPYFEWVIELPEGERPALPGALFVDDLGPFIERKLFTVNTGHCTAAWVGQTYGYERIAEAMSDDRVRDMVQAVLDETSAILVDKYAQIDSEGQAAYVQTIMNRFENPGLDDAVSRVGRSPIRKLGPNERFINPIVQGIERGLPVTTLLRVVQAGLDFRADGDNEVDELARLVADSTPEQLVQSVMGVSPGSPAFEPLAGVINRSQ